MTYVDGMVAAVPTASREAFLAHAEAAALVFRAHGALSVVECWGDEVPEGEVTSLPMAVKCAGDETVCFSWIMWPSKAVRDAAWPRIAEDPRMAEAGPMPFDGKRMIFGGFSVLMNTDAAPT